MMRYQPFLFVALLTGVACADRIIEVDTNIETDLTLAHQQQSLFQCVFSSIVPEEEVPNFSPTDWSFLSEYMSCLSESALEEVVGNAYAEVREFVSVITESYEAKWRRMLMQQAYAIMVR
ncbi:hypothetical protein JW872_01225 [Candidatus Babeliales bacterium]|nr:hypothetical protein [Candidatus Babeliales bacterium]